MALFKIRGSDQNEYGPVPADVVVQWITANRLARQSLARAEGSTEWKPLSEFPEFQSALAAQSTPPPPLASAYSPPAGHRHGMATASLVLGICGITCLSVLAGIPAIILGHLGYNRARKYPGVYGGSGMAIAGLVMGYLSLIWLPLMAALLLPALAKAKERAEKVSCANQMKTLTAEINLYANEHGSCPNLLVLSNKLAAPKFLVCPGDTTRRRRLTWNDVGISGSSYIYTIPAPKTGTFQEAASLVVLRCPVHGNVAHVDGSVSQGPRKQGSGRGD